MGKARRVGGFTLIEVMITVAVLGIVVAIAAPSFSSSIKNNRMASVASEIRGGLQYARAEGVRRGGGVRVSAISSDISNGLRVWIDDGDDVFQDGEELRILRFGGSGLHLSAMVGGAEVPNIFVVFNTRGSVGNLTDSLTIGICDDRIGNYGRRIVLLASGGVHTSKGVNCMSGGKQW